MNKAIVLVMMMVGLLFTTAACGDKQPAEETAPTQAEQTEVATVHNESDILEWLGVVNDGPLMYYYTTDGVECEIAVVMTTAPQVSMYADAGDVTAANADGTAGVKISSPEAATCQQALNEHLAEFPDGEQPAAAQTAPVEGEETLELAASVTAYSDMFLTGHGEQSYTILSKRCAERIDKADFDAMTEQASDFYGGALPIKTFEADVSGNMARVTYTYEVPALNQTSEPWVYEDGQWRQDDC